MSRVAGVFGALLLALLDAGVEIGVVFNVLILSLIIAMIILTLGSLNLSMTSLSLVKFPICFIICHDYLPRLFSLLFATVILCIA